MLSNTPIFAEKVLLENTQKNRVKMGKKSPNFRADFTLRVGEKKVQKVNQFFVLTLGRESHFLKQNFSTKFAAKFAEINLKNDAFYYIKGETLKRA